jgi:PST family polysaccharide transporter
MIERVRSIYNNTGFRKYFTNTSWLLAEKIFRMVLGLLVGICVARYLGPEQFGRLNFVLAFVGLFIPFSKLGLDSIIVRDLVRNEDERYSILGSCVYMKLIGSFVVLGIILTAILILKNDPIYVWMTFFVGVSIVFKASDAFEFYFRSMVLSKYSVMANMAGFISSSLLKIVLVLVGSGLLYFAFAFAVEAAVTALAVFFLYRRYNGPVAMVFEPVKAKSMLKESWPMIFSGFFAIIYLNIDQVMLEQIKGSYEVGQYSAAVRVSSAWYFIPMAIGWSVQTAVVKAKEKSEKLYLERLFMLFTLLAVAAYILVVPVSYFSQEIIELLYGSAFMIAGKVLAIHILATVFVFVGVARGLWVSTESHFRFALFSNMAAGLLNVVLNIIWIPGYGALGAAWATVISYFVTYIGSGFFYKPAIRIALMQIRALMGIGIFQLLLGHNFKETAV